MQKIILLVLSIFLLSYSNSNSEQVSPFTFLKVKSEKRGNNLNQMELYAVDKNTRSAALKDFCLQKKSEFMKDGSRMFSFVIFFDNKVNAGFPNNPFTAGFNEDVFSKHIKAMYSFNRLNGYSDLTVYEKNAWESLAKNIKI
ncbi:MAG: hypothetical protein V4694_07300 [Pseudomonadota bacterium]